MRLPKNVRENLFFLTAEIQSQVSGSQVFLETRSLSIAQRILDRRGYSYNLKMRIYDSCVECLRHGPKGSLSIFSLRAAEAIASELERIGHLCFECVHLAQKIEDNQILIKSGATHLLDEVLRAIGLIERALDDEDEDIALKIANINHKLERLYNNVFRTVLKKIHKNKKTDDAITTLFIAKRIEEMGDVMLCVSEAIMSAKFGQPMHIDRFRSLKTAMSDLGLIEADVAVIAQTKSGSGISAISDPTSNGNGVAAIFKDGSKEKLKEERDSVENWHEIFPGLAPQIISYNKQGKNASLLIEHLSGMTFDKVLVNETDETLHKALKTLIKTLKAVWKETKRKNVFAPNHMRQLRKRLNSVLEIHPHFNTPMINICGVENPSLDNLIDQAEALEKEIDPIFSVYIHGDFNLDNIIYDVDMKTIKFIDLHRSCYQDYTQDISVFMISNFRLQVFKKETRQRIATVAQTIYDFASGFAEKQDDKTFDFRLALGLARSFITSTRFILDAELANAMFLRGVFILEQITQLDEKKANDFKLPIRELFS